VAVAAPASELDQRLASLDASFQAAVERDANAAFKASMAALDKSYLGALERFLATASKGGKLEEALALREEKQRIEKGEGVPSEVDESTQAPGKVPDTLKTLRKTYRSTTAQHEATKAKAMQPLYDKYDQALAAVQTELTKANQLDDAMRVKTVREQIAATRGTGEGSAGASTIASTPGGSATTSAPPTGSTLLFTNSKDFTNSLGMKLVKVSGTDILMCIHETRRSDYAAYATEMPSVNESWKNQVYEGIPCGDKDDHPVVGVSWVDAQAFCAWLSKKEGKTYRLPTDQEWSIAVGLGRHEKWDKNTTPIMFSGKVAEFPWGGTYPPRTNDKAGNYADTSLKDKPPTLIIIEGYTDGFATTAPVMSFKPNKQGIYDLGGNVSEWCEDWVDDVKNQRTRRGGNFASQGGLGCHSDFRSAARPDINDYKTGFRIVLENRAPASPSGAATKPATPTPTPTAAPAPAPATAAKSDFTNSLGMQFVKVPGTKVLFCIHETRYKDYAAYDAETPGLDRLWKDQTIRGVTLKDRTEDHPANSVSWEDAKGFCAWLSQKEGKRYRLPKDEEWSYAAGIGRDEKRKKGDTPGTLASVPNEYPWGANWPPPKGSGNYGDESYNSAVGAPKVLTGYDDGYPTTAPVMSFKPNRYGLYDMAGNVMEWCEDWFDNTQKSHVFRSSSWMNGGNNWELLSSYRDRGGANVHESKYGFRIVLETNE
jgi:formylglycine-generating enzyme required for sulfatase activity